SPEPEVPSIAASQHLVGSMRESVASASLALEPEVVDLPRVDNAISDRPGDNQTVAIEPTEWWLRIRVVDASRAPVAAAEVTIFVGSAQTNGGIYLGRKGNAPIVVHTDLE